MDGGRVIPASKFSADARGKAGGGPTLEQLKTAVKQHLIDHPDINTTVPQQLLSDAGYELIYTPPYVSDLQPIELIWAYTKALVARQSTRRRTVEEAAIHTRQAMDQVTKELCQDVIRHAQQWMDRFIQSEEGGSLQQFGSLASLTAASVGVHQAAATDTAYTTWVPQTADEEDDQEERVSTRVAQAVGRTPLLAHRMLTRDVVLALSSSSRRGPTDAPTAHAPRAPLVPASPPTPPTIPALSPPMHARTALLVYCSNPVSDRRLVQRWPRTGRISAARGPDARLTQHSARGQHTSGGVCTPNLSSPSLLPPLLHAHLCCFGRTLDGVHREP